MSLALGPAGAGTSTTGLGPASGWEARLPIEGAQSHFEHTCQQVGWLCDSLSRTPTSQILGLGEGPLPPSTGLSSPVPCLPL